jgi:hypothetical protein
VNPLILLHEQGQAIWLDFLSRRFIAEGGLKRLIDQDSLTGVTSNPSIFKKAIGDSSDYDAAIRGLVDERDGNVMKLYEQLAITDIQNAADVLRPVYKATERADGFVSLEVSPYIARDTAATIAEARRLWKEVDRENASITQKTTFKRAVDHLIPERFARRFFPGGDPHVLENLYVITPELHAKKTAIERLVYKGDLVGYTTELIRLGWTREQIDRALKALWGTIPAEKK